MIDNPNGTVWKTHEDTYLSNKWSLVVVFVVVLFIAAAVIGTFILTR